MEKTLANALHHDEVARKLYCEEVFDAPNNRLSNVGGLSRHHPSSQERSVGAEDSHGLHAGF